MSQNKTVLLMALVFCSALFTSQAQAECTKQTLNERMVGVVFDFFRIRSALENKSISHFQKAAIDLSVRAERRPTDIHIELRSPQSTGGICKDLEEAIERGSKKLLRAKNLHEAEQETNEFQKIITVWSYLGQQK